VQFKAGAKTNRVILPCVLPVGATICDAPGRCGPSYKRARSTKKVRPTFASLVAVLTKFSFISGAVIRHECLIILKGQVFYTNDVVITKQSHCWSASVSINSSVRAGANCGPLHWRVLIWHKSSASNEAEKPCLYYKLL